MILILSQYTLTKPRDRFQLNDSKTLDTGLTFRCTRPVIYQPHEAAGELLKRNSRIAPAEVASLRFNLGSDRKLRKRQNSTSKQM
jgi:hypothetical protein